MLATMGLVIASCGKGDKGTSETKDGKKVVKVWAWDKNFNVGIMEKAAEIYEAKHPDVDIEVVDYGRVDIETKLHTGLSTGNAKSLPQIVLVEDYTAKKFLTSYPGSFANLQDKVDYSKFADYKVEIMKDDKGTYGIPFDSGVAGYFYRKDLLEKAGLTEEDITGITWQEFIEIGNKVKEATGVNMISGDLAGDAGLIRIMMQSAGKWYFDKDGNVDIANNEALKEAFKVLQGFHKNSTMKPTTGWGEWVASMNKGETASVVTGVWIMPSITAQADQSGKWGVTNIPKLNVAGAKEASNLGGSSWYVVNGSKNSDVAVDFLNTVYAGNEEFYQKILVENGAIGTYLPSQKGEAYQKQVEFFGNDKVYEKFSGWIKEIPAVNYGSFVSEADTAVLNGLKLVLDGKATIDEALKTAEEEVKRQIR